MVLVMFYWFSLVRMFSNSLIRSSNFWIDLRSSVFPEAVSAFPNLIFNLVTFCDCWELAVSRPSVDSVYLEAT